MRMWRLRSKVVAPFGSTGYSHKQRIFPNYVLIFEGIGESYIRGVESV